MLPPKLHYKGKSQYSPVCAEQKTFLSRTCGGVLMGFGTASSSAVKKAKKCPFFKSRKEGKWTTLVCTIPADGICPNPHCQAHPDYQEPDPHAGD